MASRSPALVDSLGSEPLNPTSSTSRPYSLGHLLRHFRHILLGAVNHTDLNVLRFITLLVAADQRQTASITAAAARKRNLILFTLSVLTVIVFFVQNYSDFRVG